MSAVLAIPTQTRRSAVIGIFVMASGGLFYSGSLATLRGESYEKFSHRFRYAVVPFLGYVILFGGGILLRQYGAVGLDVIAAGMLTLINLAIRNTWAIAVAMVESQD